MKFFKALKKYLFNLLLFTVRCIPKKKNLILFGAWFGEKYSDNSMYLYEYMLNDSFFEIYWVTRNKEVYDQLIKENKPVVLSNSLHGILLQIRAKVMVASVDKADFNPYFIGGTTFINLCHGIPLKKSGFDRSNEHEPGLNEYLDQLLMFNRYNKDVVVSSSFLITEVFKSLWRMADEIICLGLPRNDLFYNKSLYNNNNSLRVKIKENRKAIVYMPTHRNEGQSKIPISEIFDLNLIQKYCEKYDFVFIIKKHFYHKNELENLTTYSRIIDITNEDINPQLLLFEADILITDYSSCFFDYLLLDRPLLFYCYDWSDYETNRGVYFKYEEITAGPKCKTKDEFNEQLNIVLSRGQDDYIDFRRTVRNKFFDKNNQNMVCPQISNYIKSHYLT